MATRPLTLSDVEITLECLPEDTPIEGNAMASGDDAADREQENWIREELASGNEWAWCCAKVTASYNGFSASDYLRCCSYLNEQDFKTGGYFESMVSEALDALNKLIAETDARIPHA